MACEESIFHFLTLGVTLNTDGAVFKLSELPIIKVAGLYTDLSPAEAPT